MTNIKHGDGTPLKKHTSKAPAMPKMTPVKSSTILAIGYDDIAKALHVTFKGGGHYSYAEIPRSLHDEMLGADSVGSFFHSRIKSNKDFKHTKIETKKKEEHHEHTGTDTGKG